MTGKKKSRVEEDDSEELWIYSYADLMSLLLTFFIIFFSFSTEEGSISDEIIQQIIETFTDQKYEKTSRSDAGLKTKSFEIRAIHILLAALNIDESQENVERISNIVESERDLDAAKKALKTMVEEKNIENAREKYSKAILNDLTVDIILPAHTIFESGSDKLTLDSSKKLKDLAETIIKIEHLAEIQISGHTDSAPLGQNQKFYDNWELSSARASAVAREIIKYGVDQNIVSVSGFSSMRPLLPDKDENGQYILNNMEINRRVEITLKRKAFN